MLTGCVVWCGTFGAPLLGTAAGCSPRIQRRTGTVPVPGLCRDRRTAWDRLPECLDSWEEKQGRGEGKKVREREREGKKE